MERRSRAALKKAPVHVVLSLELQALQLVEQVRGGFPGGGRDSQSDRRPSTLSKAEFVWSAYKCPLP